MRFLWLGLSLLVGLGLYPFALAMVLLADTFLGTAEFIHQLLFGSHRALLFQVLSDWWAALPYALVLWFAVRALRRLGLAAMLLPGLASAVLLVLAFVPPYVPMIFGALLFWATLLSLGFDGLRGRVQA